PARRVPETGGGSALHARRYQRTNEDTVPGGGMPLYEYACRACGGTFERMRKTAERLSAPPCPSCASAEALLVMSAARMVCAGASGHAFATMREGGSGSCCGGACMH